MDRDRAEGATKQQTGKIKEKAGEWTGDEKTRQEGKADQTEGKVQNTIGSAKEKVKETFGKK